MAQEVNEQQLRDMAGAAKIMAKTATTTISDIIQMIVKYGPWALVVSVVGYGLWLEFYIVPTSLGAYYSANTGPVYGYRRMQDAVEAASFSAFVGFGAHVLIILILMGASAAAAAWFTKRGIFDVFTSFNAKVMDNITGSFTSLVGSKLEHDASMHADLSNVMLTGYKAGHVMGKAVGGDVNRDQLMAELSRLDMPEPKFTTGIDKQQAQDDWNRTMEDRRQRLGDV